MKLKMNLILLFTLVILGTSCGGRVTKKALKTGEELKSSIEDFEKDRQKFSTQVATSIETANEALAEEDPNLPEIAKDWEKEWKDIQSRYEKMQKDFLDVGETSTAYFEQLNSLADGINDEALKKSEKDKNVALLNRWKKHYSEAEASINSVEKVLQDGNDFHRVLVMSSVRQKLENNVVELKRISDRAKALLADLEEFTKAGRELVEG